MLTCPACFQTMVKIKSDSEASEIMVCKNNRCLKSIFHSDAKCPECDAPPVKILRGSNHYTSYLCENSHEFSEQLKPGHELYK